MYPVQAPYFRFITVPYHINISIDGEICMNSIEKGYLSSKKVIDMIQEIKELLIFADINSPIRLEAYSLFVNQPQEYEKRARDSRKNAIDDVYKYIDSLIVVDDIPSDFKLPINDYVPPYLISQISGMLIPKEKMVLASSGVLYDRDELKQFVIANNPAVCIITGNTLTEEPEYL